MTANATPPPKVIALAHNQPSLYTNVFEVTVTNDITRVAFGMIMGQDITHQGAIVMDMEHAVALGNFILQTVEKHWKTKGAAREEKP